MPSTVPIRPFSRRLNSIEMSSTSATVNSVAQLRRSGVNVVDLGPGEPHFATPEHIKQAAIAAIYDNKTTPQSLVRQNCAKLLFNGTVRISDQTTALRK